MDYGTQRMYEKRAESEGFKKLVFNFFLAIFIIGIVFLWRFDTLKGL